MTKKQKKMLYRILISAGMVLVWNLIPVTGILRLLLFLAAYLVIGCDILKRLEKESETAVYLTRIFLWQ